MIFSSFRRSWYSQFIIFCLVVTFAVSMVSAPQSSYAQGGVMGLPQPGAMVDLSAAYVPLMITGLSVHPENPLLMDFIVNTGNSGMSADQVKEESDRLIKYFLACLTIPENDQWVNLSPYEKQRIISEDLGQTVLGQDMLAQDYLLKQLTASLIYPEKNLGRKFWDQVYGESEKRFGTAQIPVNTFNKVWILPDTAKVYEHKDTVFVVKSHLKVMLDEDYFALRKHASLRGAEGDAAIFNRSTNLSNVNNLGSQIVRQIILPAIEKEVNSGKNFAPLRQIYNSMILAVWFKMNLKQALLNQIYTDKSKVNGVNVDDPSIKEKIYQQYLQAYKKGVFNYIKEEVNQTTQETIPRKYFSGGLTAVDEAMIQEATRDEAMTALNSPGDNFRVSGLTREANRNSTNDERDRRIVFKYLSRIELQIALNGQIGSMPIDSLEVFHNGLRLSIKESPKEGNASKIIDALEQKVGKDSGRKFIYHTEKFKGTTRIYITDAAMTVEVKPILNARLAKFGTAGDRGIIDWDGDGKGDFNIDLVRRDVQGIAAHLLKTTDLRTIIIGYDTRRRNPEFSREAASIMAANGFKVLYAAQEATPTPVLAILAVNRNVAGVINFTASHSPYTDGGIKFSSNHGGSANSETTDSIEKLANESTVYKVTDYEGAVRDGRITELDSIEVIGEYVNGYLIPTLKNTKAPNGVSAWDDIINYIKQHPEFHLVIDPMQGSGVRTMQVLFGEIANVVGRQFFKVIHTDNKDPQFMQTGGAPQPSGKYVQGLLDEVKRSPNAMGIAVDGDVDRFGVVDFGGKQLEANEMLGMFAWFLKKDIGLEGALVKTVATSNFANAVAKYLGMKLIETPVGFKYSVQQVMNGEKVLVAGEESAHVATGPFIKSWDDGFAVDLMTLWLVAKTGKTLAEYKSEIEKEIGQSFALKVNTVRDAQGVAKASVVSLIATAKKEMESHLATEITLAKQAEQLAGQKVVDINTMDGVKLVFNSGDSILMRPSGTEPAARLYVEVSNPHRLDAMFKVAEELMRVSGKAQVSEGALEDEDSPRPTVTREARSVSTDDINYKNPTSQDVKRVVESARYLGFRQSVFDSIQEKLKGLFSDKPLESEVGLGFVISAKRGNSYRRLDSLNDFLEFDSFQKLKLIEFLQKKFPTKQVVFTKPTLDRKTMIIFAKVVLTDKAMIMNSRATKSTSPGGIDLNSKALSMQTSGQKVDITFDPAMIVQFKRGDFSGVRIQILDVLPVNIMPLLGLKEEN